MLNIVLDIYYISILDLLWLNTWYMLVWLTDCGAGSGLSSSPPPPLPLTVTLSQWEQSDKVSGCAECEEQTMIRSLNT